MSAYILNDNEIDTIVSYFLNPNNSLNGNCAWLKIGDRYDYLNGSNAAEVASILMAENVRSVNARYREQTPVDYKFKYDPSARKRPVGNIIGALDCYEYQSCETDDWQDSNAWEIVCGLRKQLLKNIAEEDGTYTWGIK